MRIYTFRAVIEPDDAKHYHGFVPLLKGVHTQGETIREVKQNLREAIRCHLQGLLKDHESMPQEEETFESIYSFSEKDLVVSTR